jgi:hypothetical protein
MATAAAPRMATAIRPMARSMVAAGKAGTAVGIMATLMATASLVTRGMRALRATKAMVALATASQDVPVLAGTAAGLDMAAEAGMVAGATTDDQDQEVRQQQPVLYPRRCKISKPFSAIGMLDMQGRNQQKPGAVHGEQQSFPSGVLLQLGSVAFRSADREDGV